MMQVKHSSKALLLTQYVIFQYHCNQQK